MISRGLFALHNLMLFNSKILIKRRVLLEAAWAAAAKFYVFNVIRETAGVGAEHPAHKPVTGWWWVLVGQTSWVMWTVQEVSWHTARLGDGGTVPILAAQAGEQLGKQRVWVVAICVSSLVTCAAMDESAQFAVCQAMCICIYSFSTSWHVAEH